jgi:hypothetical protein
LSVWQALAISAGLEAVVVAVFLFSNRGENLNDLRVFRDDLRKIIKARWKR